MRNFVMEKIAKEMNIWQTFFSINQDDVFIEKAENGEYIPDLHIYVSEGLSNILNGNFGYSPNDFIDISDELLNSIEAFYKEMFLIYEIGEAKEYYNIDYRDLVLTIEFDNIEKNEIKYVENCLTKLFQRLEPSKYFDRDSSIGVNINSLECLFNDLESNLGYYCDRYSQGRVIYSWIVFCMFKDCLEEFKKISN